MVRLTLRNAKGAKTLQRLLDARGWTVTTLQQRTRIPEETTSKWLAGTARPGRTDLLTLASVFGEGDWAELFDAYGAHKLVTVLQSRQAPFDPRGEHGDIYHMDHLRLRPDQRKPDSSD